MKVDPVVLGTEHLAIGEEPLRVEQLCQVTNTLIDRQTFGSPGSSAPRDDPNAL